MTEEKKQEDDTPVGPIPETDHVVYILGAGFSADAGLPLVNNFLDVMRDCLPWFLSQLPWESQVSKTAEEEQKEKYYRESAESIRRIMEFKRQAQGAGYRVQLDLENIEELFSLASASKGETWSQQIADSIAATLDYAEQIAKVPICAAGFPGLPHTEAYGSPANPVKEWLKLKQLPWILRRDKPYLGYPVYDCPLYDYYALVLSGYTPEDGRYGEHNTILTFNYDTVLESSFERLGIGYNYGMDKEKIKGPTKDGYSYPEKQRAGRICYYSESGVPILKLHGSTNWNFNSHDKTVSLTRDFRTLRLDGMRPLIVPPTWQKNFNETIYGVWQKAIDALRKATHIVIIGFSIPTTDTHFKYLLGAGLQDSISLRKIFFVNPDAEKDWMQDRLKKLFNPVLLNSARFITRAEYADQFFGNPKMLEEIGRSEVQRVLPQPE